jgi:hypothetical protein
MRISGSVSRQYEHWGRFPLNNLPQYGHTRVVLTCSGNLADAAVCLVRIRLGVPLLEPE